MRNALLAALVTLFAAFAGCTRAGEAESTPTPDWTPTLPSAMFQVNGLSIRPVNDSERLTLYEDDAAAIVRYVIQQPENAPRETAFVTYLFNGRTLGLDQITLSPGETRAFERRVDDLRLNSTFAVEVRAGGSSDRARAHVVSWPRAGVDTLPFGPLSIRADYGLLEQGNRALVNLTIDHIGPAEVFDGLRARMICADEQGRLHNTTLVRMAPPPTIGNASRVELLLDDCRHERYAIEFIANLDGGREVFGRLLLVPRGWAPPA